jgi:hypothetical protein
MLKRFYMKELIDFRNEKLWTELKEHFNITFEESQNGEYSCYTQNDDVTFYYVKSNLCIDSFTHEMLHVYLRMNDCFIGGGLKNTINQSKILTSILSFELIEHMGNCLDHIKMLPIYLNMGFDREKFILDYHDHKCSNEELKFLKKNYKISKKVNPVAVDLYFGKFFAIKADPNNSFDYSSQLSVLKKIDPLLFQISERMIDFWNEIKIENRQIIDDNYHSVLFEYYENLKKWISKTRFTN